MKLVETPALRPFTSVDGSQNGPVIDTQITHLAYGRMYWSSRLVVEAARLLDMVTADELHDVAAELAVAKLTIAELEGELAELEPVSRALQSVAARFGDVQTDDEPVRRKQAA